MATQELHNVELVILDLDGVITQTAAMHAEAWKRMFDDFLLARSYRRNETFEPFSIDRDYKRYVDGKPRYEGVAAFLESRDIQYPRGDPSDPPDKETVCGLGNRKNQLFRQLLESEGVTVFPDAVAQIRAWRRQGIKMAVVSSSKNCERVLAAAGLSDFFDARVDGVVAAQRGLRGKPDPDIFLEAARELDVDPSRAIVIEDAAAGVRAGSAGGFLCTIGLARDGNQETLRQQGADIVVRTLEELDVSPLPKTPGQTTDSTTAARAASPDSSSTLDVPLASDHLDEIWQRLQGKHLAIFLDYDGTLTAIVQRPEDAQLGAAMRHTLERLAQAFTVAIVSGRDRADVKQLVGLDELIYAGSHGFDISGPSGLKLEQPEGVKCLPELDRVEMLLRDRLDGVPEAQVERKRFAIAIHYRRVAAEHVEWVERVVDEVHRDASMLRKKGGKKIFELQPDVPWDKGRAVLWLLEELGLDRAEVVPLYVGDDETDEDAFRALYDRGFGVVVQETPRATAATYRVPDPSSVQEFFEALLAGDRSPEEITG